MLERSAILAFCFAVLGCRMDNPAFDLQGGSEAADGTRGSDSTNPEESSDSLGDGDGDGDGGDGDGDGEAETTDGECVPSSNCGPCLICDDNGECVPDVGADCDGPALHCAEYLYGEAEGICYKLADVTLTARCSEQGLCEQKQPSDCPLEVGPVHFACDLTCVTDPDSCVQFGKAAEVEMSAMCLVNGEQTSQCKSKCANGIQSVIEEHGCVIGECQPVGQLALCNGYICDEQEVACLESCETDAQCSQQFTCAEAQCVPG